jgi:hypothetical protein
MCVGNPEELLKQLLEADPLVKNHLKHTALDDFDHLCAAREIADSAVND